MIAAGLVPNQEFLVKAEAESLYQGTTCVEIVESSVMTTPSASLKNVLVVHENLKFIVKLVSDAPSNSSYAHGIVTEVK